MNAPGRRLRVLLIRHAQTAQNHDGIVQGRADHPLSALGERQASALGHRLASQALTAVYASPLQRARQTADAVARPHALAVVPVPDLIEMDIGEMEGLSSRELRVRFPDFLRIWSSAEAGAAVMPGGESLAQVQERAGIALDMLLERHLGGAIAIVNHNFVLLTLMCRVLGLPLHGFRRLRQHVAGVTAVEITAEGHRLIGFNDVCHLEHEGLLGDDLWSRPR